MDGVIERLGRIAAAVPAGVELGYHLCYGDYRGEHFKQPADTGLMTDLANRIGAASAARSPGSTCPFRRIGRTPATSPRSSGWISARRRSVPRPRPPRRRHRGARRRIDAAGSVVGAFGVATECGMAAARRSTSPS